MTIPSSRTVVTEASRPNDREGVKKPYSVTPGQVHSEPHDFSVERAVVHVIDSNFSNRPTAVVDDWLISRSADDGSLLDQRDGKTCRGLPSQPSRRAATIRRGRR